VDFVEICNVYIGKMIIKAAKRIFNSDKICRSYSDLNFDVTFLEHSVLDIFSALRWCAIVVSALLCLTRNQCLDSILAFFSDVTRERWGERTAPGQTMQGVTP